MDADYWRVSPGSLYVLLERNEKYPNYFPSKKVNPLELEDAARWWSEPLVDKATKTGSHDLGFKIIPDFKKEYVRTHCSKFTCWQI